MKGFSIKTEIEEYDTFERFAKEAQLGEKDLVLCGEHTYKQYVEPLSLGVQTLFREKYGKANRQTVRSMQFLMRCGIRTLTGLLQSAAVPLLILQRRLPLQPLRIKAMIYTTMSVNLKKDIR